RRDDRNAVHAGLPSCLARTKAPHRSNVKRWTTPSPGVRTRRPAARTCTSPGARQGRLAAPSSLPRLLPFALPRPDRGLRREVFEEVLGAVGDRRHRSLEGRPVGGGG